MPISFPSSPTLNQTYSVGNKTWVWNGYGWNILTANTSNIQTLAQAAFNQANSAASVANTDYTTLTITTTTSSSNGTFVPVIQVSSNGRILSVTNTSILASTADATQNLSIAAAFSQANVTVGVDATQNASITIIQGVNNTQNASITVIQGVDNTQNLSIQSAFNQANVTVGVDNTQNASITIIQGVDNTQNNRLTIIESVDLTQNNQIQAAYNQANVTVGVDATQNASITIIQGVDNTQNASITVIQGVDNTQNLAISAAFAQANVTVGVDNTQNASITIIQGVDNTQNASITVIQGVDATQNLSITAAYFQSNTTNILAQAAYNRANITVGIDSTQNLSISAAYTRANNSLNANTGGNVTGALYVSGVISTTASAADEGGQIELAVPQTNSTLSGPIAIDIYQNKLRFFEASGTNRGAYIDLSAATAGVGSNLLSGGGGSVTSVAGATGAVSNNQILSGLQAVSSTNSITFDFVATANNGNGTNFKVGDDAWIGDYNAANSIKVKGQQDATQGYISFGSNSSSLGVSGTGQLTYGGFTVWSSGNDGSASGLDADLLDGLQGSEYANTMFAQAAFNQANVTVGVDATQNASIVVIQGVDNTQNSNITIIQNVDLTQNNQIQAAFDQANSAAQFANTDNTVIVATTSSSNGTFVPVIQVAANGRVLSITNTAIVLGGGSSSGYLANSVIFANSTGFLSNTANLSFTSTTTPNSLKVNGSIVLANTATSNSATIVYNASLNSIDFIFN